MEKRETLEKIIKQDGSCVGIKCLADNCPFYDLTRRMCTKHIASDIAIVQAQGKLSDLENDVGKMSKFNVGDLVFCAAFGWGHVKPKDTDISENYLILVVHSDGEAHFTKEGRFHTRDFSPTLFTKEEAAIKFPEYPAPKRKVTKTLERWVNVFPNEEVNFFKRKEHADSWNEGSNVERITCEKITIPYEIWE